ncbi:MAG TPA: ATP-binding protein [Azospira sp.]|nr:ATP-binding protein [Azospira sp.]
MSAPVPLPQASSATSLWQRLTSRMLPKTLLVRAFLLVAVLLLVSVATWITLFRFAEREPRARQLAQLSASVVNLTRAALVNADPVRRQDLLRELSVREGLRLYPVEPDDVLEPLPERDFFTIFQREARVQLGPHARFGLAVNGQPGFWISFRIDDGDAGADGSDDYWLVLPRERAERNMTWQWLGWGAVALVLALAAAWLLVSRINRPLKAMAKAARAVGRGERPPPLDENGAEEVRLLARAMNQMNADLERLEAERAQVLAGISHDLRTPLARLRLAVEMGVEDDGLQQGMSEDIGQMDGIIGQFLDYARGEEQEAQERLDAGELLRSVAGRYAARGQVLAVDIEPLPALPLRPRALERAVINLIDNALKYGGSEVTLGARAEAGGVVLEVRDRGPGIPAAEVERLKRPFTRLELARSDTTGTGLGLAIVERIARLHGGRLELLPREGGGLIARVTLPG